MIINTHNNNNFKRKLKERIKVEKKMYKTTSVRESVYFENKCIVSDRDDGLLYLMRNISAQKRETERLPNSEHT